MAAPFPKPLGVPSQVSDAQCAPVNRVSTDSVYLRHEFQTWQGGYHYSNGWTPPEVRNAVTAHLRGMFWQSAMLARDCVRYPPITGALAQRLAPALKTSWKIEGSDLAPGRFAREDLEVVWTEFRSNFLGEALKDLAFMGFSWVHAHLAVDERGLEVARLKRWPLEAVMWRPRSPALAGGYYAITADSGLVRMVHGDGHWACFGHGERPHEGGAIAPLGLSYVAGEISRRDRAQLSEAAGRASPVAELPVGVAMLSEEGMAMQDVLADLGRSHKGAAVPAGTNLHPFQVVSDTSFFREALADEIALVAFALLGQAGTMSPGSGGVYTAPAFGAVAESVVEAQHEAVERGFTEGLCIPLTAINYPAIPRSAAPTLRGSRPTSHEEAKREGERALQLASTVKAQRDAGLEPTQADVDELADRLRTPTIAAGTVLSEAYAAFNGTLAGRKASGLDVTDDDIQRLAADLGVRAPNLAPGGKRPEFYAWHVETGAVARDEIRAGQSLEPLPGGVGSAAHLADRLVAEEQQAKDKADAEAAKPVLAEPDE